MEQLYLIKKFLNFDQTDRKNCPEKAIRAYRSSPFHITFQLRDHTEKKGRIASVNLTREEALQIAEFLTTKSTELRDE